MITRQQRQVLSPSFLYPPSPSPATNTTPPLTDHKWGGKRTRKDGQGGHTRYAHYIFSFFKILLTAIQHSCRTRRKCTVCASPPFSNSTHLLPPLPCPIQPQHRGTEHPKRTKHRKHAPCGVFLMFSEEVQRCVPIL